MPSLTDGAARAALVARLDALSPDATPRWGRMTPAKMLAHMTDAFRMALGELPVKPKKIPLLASFPFKQIFIYLLPFPKNAPTAPEMIARQPEAFDVERAHVKLLVERVAASPKLAVHPIFGVLTKPEWAALGYRHFDHHLRQFGV